MIVNIIFIMRSPEGREGFRDRVLLAAYCRLKVGALERLTCALCSLEARAEAASSRRLLCLVSPLATIACELGGVVGDALYARLSDTGRDRFAAVVVAHLAGRGSEALR